MIVYASIIKLSTLIKLIVGALVAGIGVTVAFSSLIYLVDRAKRASGTGAARAFQAASLLALTACLAIVAYGLVLMAMKPK